MSTARLPGTDRTVSVGEHTPPADVTGDPRDPRFTSGAGPARLRA